VVPQRKLKKLELHSAHPFHAINIVPACGPCNNQRGSKRSDCGCERCTGLWVAYGQMCHGRGTRRGNAWVRAVAAERRAGLERERSALRWLVDTAAFGRRESCVGWVALVPAVRVVGPG
jgi:hypothetical protein